MISRTARKALRKKRQQRGNSLADDPYYLGDTARHNGLAETDNPFPEGSEDSNDWLTGYREAKT